MVESDIESEETQQEEIIMSFKPVAKFPAYVTTGKQVKGIDGANLVPVELFDTEDQKCPFHDFMKVDGKIYFQIMTVEVGEPIPDADPFQYEAVEKVLYFEQVDGVVSEIKEEDYPEKPESKQIEADVSPFKISTTSEGYSKIVYAWMPENNPEKNYQIVDSYYQNDIGLWFTVPSGPADPGLNLITCKEGKFRNKVSGSDLRIW